jgi:hypothetical protein
MAYERTCVLRVFGLRVGAEGYEVREEVAGDALRGGRFGGGEKEAADAVCGDFGRLGVVLAGALGGGARRRRIIPFGR